jgi:hypothetical protein
MKENPTYNLNLNQETAAWLLDIVCRIETPSGDDKKDSLCDTIKVALRTPQQPPLEAGKEEARTSLAQSVKNLAQAQDAYAESLAHGSESGQRAAWAAVGTEETRLQGSQAAYDAAAAKALKAMAESTEGNRRAAYTKSEKAHGEALAALQGYESLAQEMSKLFRILSFHADLALADVEAADAARMSPHAANAADHVKKVLQEQKLGHSEAVTTHALAALRELELAAHVRS